MSVLSVQDILLSLGALAMCLWTHVSSTPFYVHDSNIDNRMCEASEISTEVDSVSLIKCGAFCTRDASCYSVFYHHGDTRCYGCTKAYTGAANLPSATGTRFYRPFAGYQEVCDDRKPCWGTNLDCNRILGTCTCVIGYHYNPTTKTCVDSCFAYGDSFQRYPQTVIQDYDNGFVQGLLSVDACLSRCASETNFLCLSIDYVPIGGACYLSADTALTASSFVRSVVDAEHHTRNCETTTNENRHHFP